MLLLGCRCHRRRRQPRTHACMQVAGLGTIMMTLDVPVLNVTYTSVTKLNLSGTIYDSVAANTLTARLLAKAVLACPRACGDFGRCVVDSNGAGLCLCDCQAPRELRGIHA